MGKIANFLLLKYQTRHGWFFYLKTLCTPLPCTHADTQVQLFMWTMVGHLLCARNECKCTQVPPCGCQLLHTVDQTGLIRVHWAVSIEEKSRFKKFKEYATYARVLRTHTRTRKTDEV